MRGNARQQWCLTGAIREHPEPAPRAPGLCWPAAVPPGAGPGRRRWRLVAVALLGVLALLIAPSIGRASVTGGAVTAGVPPDASSVSSNTTTAATGTASEATTNVAPS